MSTRRRFGHGLSALALFCLIGCTSKQPQVQPSGSAELAPNATPESATAPAEPANANLALAIGSLKGRTHTLTIYSAEDGPRYTVGTNDGQVLGERLSVDELRAQLPEVFEHFKTPLADSGSHLDASASIAE
jgi:hypothetical protein